jgi:tungstate transport system substrate-binding protein
VTRAALVLLLLAALLPCAAPAASDEARFIVLASTTSTRDSGLLASILPRFEARTGIEVRVVAVGTGRAIALAERGDADVLLVHDTASEERFVREGFGIARHPIMYNDFVIVGPADDPAGIRGLPGAAEALARIAAAREPFLSRGDDSGTHKAEMRLWAETDADPRAASGTWYRETGNGMGATLNTAAELGAYTLADRGTWLSFRNPGDLELLVENDPRLHNPYGAIVVSPERHPHVKAEAAQTFVDWLRSEEGRRAIASYRVKGQPLFFPAPRGEGPEEGRAPAP